MAQLYFLSVITLLLGGVLAASDFLTERMTGFAVLSDLTERRKLMITIGVMTALVGIVKLFLRAPNDGVPVAGDLLPALAGIAVGFVLLVGQTRRPESVGDEIPPSQRHGIIQYRNPIGLAGVLVGLLHFLFPAAVIL